MDDRSPLMVVVQGILWLGAHVIFGYKVTGVENVPETGSFLLAVNHKSVLDPMLAAPPVKRSLRYFAKRELFTNPFFGGMIRLFGAIPVDRSGPDRRAIAQALSILGSGEGLLVFPEGTRIRRPGVGEAKAGIGMMAVRTGVPVVPVWIEGSWNPRRTLFRRIPVRVRYGSPLVFTAPADHSQARRAYEDATVEIMGALATLAREATEVPA